MAEKNEIIKIQMNKMRNSMFLDKNADIFH